MKKTTGLKKFKYTSLVAITLLGAGTVTPLVANAATTETPQNGGVKGEDGVMHAVPTDGSKLFLDGLVYYYDDGALITEINNGQYSGGGDAEVNPADSNSAVNDKVATPNKNSNSSNTNTGSDTDPSNGSSSSDTSKTTVKNGQVFENGHWYFYKNNVKQTGLQYIANQHKTVYYNSNGQMQYGQQRVNGKTYYFNKATGALQK